MRTQFWKNAIAALLTSGLAVAAADLTTVQQRMKARVPDLARLKQARVVGEDRIGFLKILPGAELGKKDRAAVERENADRRLVYTDIARKLRATAAEVGRQRAALIYRMAAPGVMLQAADGRWHAKPKPQS